MYPLGKRVRALVSRLVGGHKHKSHALRLVEINGKKLKYVRMADSFRAADIEANLLAFGTSERLPTFVARKEDQLWVEFLEGRRPAQVDESFARKVAGFYAHVYTRGAHLEPTVETPFVAELERDLAFLRDVDVLDKQLADELAAAAKRLAPERLWVGFDYSDPVLKNLILSERGDFVMAFDVESLVRDRMIGMGTVKASERWLKPFQDAFFDELRQADAPDFAAYYPFVELCFLARWAKRNVLAKKWHFIDVTRFQRLV